MGNDSIIGIVFCDVIRNNVGGINKGMIIESYL